MPAVGVVVLVAGGSALVVLTARTGGCVVVVVGADVPDAAGSFDVAVDVASANCGSGGIVVGVVTAVLV